MSARGVGRTVRWPTTGAVAALLLVAGCSGGEATAPAPEEEAASATAPSAPSSGDDGGDGGGDGGDDARDGGAAPAPVGDVPSEPVAAVPGQQPGMVLEVYRLARSGETATLTMAALNESTERFSVLQAFQAGRGTDFDAGGISLLDPVGLQRYLVLRDAEGECLCSDFSNGSSSVEPRQRVHFSASFPAPPADVTSVTVETPSGSLVDVPVTEAS